MNMEQLSDVCKCRPLVWFKNTFSDVVQVMSYGAFFLDEGVQNLSDTIIMFAI